MQLSSTPRHQPTQWEESNVFHTVTPNISPHWSHLRPNLNTTTSSNWSNDGVTSCPHRQTNQTPTFDPGIIHKHRFISASLTQTIRLMHRLTLAWLHRQTRRQLNDWFGNQTYKKPKLLHIQRVTWHRPRQPTNQLNNRLEHRPGEQATQLDV